MERGGNEVTCKESGGWVGEGQGEEDFYLLPVME